MKNLVVERTFWFAGMVLLLFAILLGCEGNGAAESTATTVPTEVAIPADVVFVRETALDYLREIAAIVVPAADVPWQVTVPENQGANGTDIFLFSAQDFKLNISYPSPANEETLYYAALRNQPLDFCWQAFIDGEGHIEATDYQELEPELVNPAQVYCEEQGYTYELRTKEDGRICGACVFPDDSVCNSWDYFYGTCSPAE